MRHRLVFFSALAIALVLLAGGAAAIVLARSSDGEPRAQTASPFTTTEPAQPAPSTGDRSVAVPYVVGRSRTDAQAVLTAAGLEVNVVRVSSEEASGVVIEQSPPG